MDHEETSRQIIKTRVSISNKLPGTHRVTLPLVTPLVDNGASIQHSIHSKVFCCLRMFLTVLNLIAFYRHTYLKNELSKELMALRFFDGG